MGPSEWRYQLSVSSAVVAAAAAAAAAAKEGAAARGLSLFESPSACLRVVQTARVVVGCLELDSK